jgi:hypothetical protein
MSCCNGGRSANSPVLPRTSVATTRSSVPTTLVVFRYEGESPIIVIGRVTGTRYRFASRGAEVGIDIRDRPSVRQVPRLSELPPK